MPKFTVDQTRLALKFFAKKHNGLYQPFFARVVEVREKEGTCDVRPIDGSPEFYDVRLVCNSDNIIDGFILVPKVGSFVLCGRLENENDVFILMTSELSKCIIKCSNNGSIELNGKKYSTVKGETLRDEVSKLRDDLNSLINKFNIHEHILTLTAGTGTTAPTLSSMDVSKSDFSNILNETVKHGN